MGFVYILKRLLILPITHRHTHAHKCMHMRQICHHVATPYHIILLARGIKTIF